MSISRIWVNALGPEWATEFCTCGGEWKGSLPSYLQLWPGCIEKLEYETVRRVCLSIPKCMEEWLYRQGTGICIEVGGEFKARPFSHSPDFYFLLHWVLIVARGGGGSHCSVFSWEQVWVVGFSSCMELVTPTTLGSSWTGDCTCVPNIGRWIITSGPPGKS